MNKKLGGIPVWGWVAILAVGAYLIYRYEKSKEEGTGVEEGFEPTSGLGEQGAGEGAPGTAAPGGGIAELAAGLTALEAAGLVPKGSEAAERKEPKEAPSFWEAIQQRLIEEKLFPAPHKHKQTKAKKPAVHRKPRPHKPKPKSRPKPPNTAHHPGHTHTPSHAAAAPPATRIKTTHKKRRR